MAINIIAKNVFVTVREKHYSIAKNRKIIAEKVEIVAHVQNLHLISNKKILVKGNK